MIKRLGISSVIISVVLLILIVAFASPALAAYVSHSGFEMGTFDDWDGITGAPSVNATIVHTGNYSMRCDTTGGAGVAYANPMGSGTQATFYLYIATLPSSDCAIIGNTAIVNVKLTTSSELDLYYGASKKADGTTQLQASQWYRVSIAGETATDNMSLWIDGNLEHDNINVSTYGTGATNFVGILESVTADLYFDDVVLGDSEDMSDLGDIRVLRSVPEADATHDDWKDTGDGAQTWDDVDEAPPASIADYAWFEANGVLNQQTWTTTNMTTLGIDGMEVNAISSWFYYVTAGGGANEYYTYMRDNGTDYSTGIDDPKTPTWVNRYDATMPNGGGAWTEARVDAYEIGMATDDANKDIWCYTAYKMIAYTYEAAGTPDISVSPTIYDFGTVAESSVTNTTTTYFTITNSSSMQTDQTISVTTSSWSSGGSGWTHDDGGSAGVNTASLKAQRGGTWGSNVVVVKNVSPNYIYENCPASTGYAFGLSLLAPTTLSDGYENTITVRVSAVAD